MADEQPQWDEDSYQDEDWLKREVRAVKMGFHTLRHKRKRLKRKKHRKRRGKRKGR